MIEENIIEVPNFIVRVYNIKAKLALPDDFRGRALVVGAYFNPHWQMATHSAYHVIFEDGTRDTVKANHCKGE